MWLWRLPKRTNSSAWSGSEQRRPEHVAPNGFITLVIDRTGFQNRLGRSKSVLHHPQTLIRGRYGLGLQVRVGAEHPHPIEPRVVLNHRFIDSKVIPAHHLEKPSVAFIADQAAGMWFASMKRNAGTMRRPARPSSSMCANSSSEATSPHLQRGRVFALGAPSRMLVVVNNFNLSSMIAERLRREQTLSGAHDEWGGTCFESESKGFRRWPCRSDFHLISGMAPDEHLALASLAHLDVDCGGGNGTVAEKRLNMPQVHSILQERRRNCMSKHVWGNTANASTTSVSVQNCPDMTGRTCVLHDGSRKAVHSG